MATLLEKIDASARSRLILPPNRRPSEELARYKNFLKVETHRLKMLHRAGGGGREICRARATILDVLQRHIFEATHRLQPDPDRFRLSLVAIGGYGRAELNPYSDIDIMFLHDGEMVARGKTHPYLTAMTDGLLYTLWDLGLKVGHSVRSLEDCVKVANGDMQSKTSLIEARLIIGADALFQSFQKALVAKCVEGHEEEYIEQRLADQAERRQKFGNAACMQEPNIKNGCGGLRDYQNLFWMAFVKYRTRTLEELEARELINDSESRQLGAAYDFLLRTRNDLHYHLERPVEVLTKSVQPAVAHNLGYTDRSPSLRLEKFMRDYYTHTRNIDFLTRTLEQRLALLPQPRRLPTLGQIWRTQRQRMQQQILDGFKFVDGYIHPGSRRVFTDQPRRLMRVFLYAQQRGLKLHSDLAHLIRNHLSLVNREFLADSHVHSTFLEILNQRGGVAPVLRAMHEVGFLGKYLPEFGRLTCLVQHEFYHQYTADEHTLVCLEKLDQIGVAEDEQGRYYAELYRSVERPFLLYLALLLHDSGKAAKSDSHSELGGKLSVRVARRMNLDGATTHSLRLIIEHHLTMAQISQRRDLDDPAVIRTFAQQVQTTENLSMLTLHTLADSLGTSDQLWNGFKDTLLRTLHHKTWQILSGSTEFVRAEAKQRELLMQEVSRLVPKVISLEEVQAHFTNLPPRYFQTRTAAEISSDLFLTHCFMHLQLAEEDQALAPVVYWQSERDRGYSSVKICTWDRPGLFSKITGSFGAIGINILSAEIFTRDDGIVLDTFFVTDGRTGRFPSREKHEQFESLVRKVMMGEPVDLAALISSQKESRPLYQSIEGERIETRIHFDNTISETRTVIEIQTEDRVGLLYFISQALTELDLSIFVAKISTEKGAAIDSFYVGEADGSKVVAPQRQAEIARKVHSSIMGLSL